MTGLEFVKRGTKIVLLGVGSFNPPTIMHLRMFEIARDHLEMILGCKVVEGIMSPVADTYGKTNLASATHRLEMTRLAAATSTWIRADGWESTQKSWSRTLQVLGHHQEQAKEKYGNEVRLMLVGGGDLVDSFTRILENGENLWHPNDISSIVSDYGLLVISRENSDPLGTLNKMEFLRNNQEKVQFITEDVCPCDVSSTRIRKAIKEGRSIKYAVVDPVLDYIQKVGLYH
ncbi:unnamed protein product, partial [Mesorhabditis belari]|uniref:Nicotinamide-nucleotide adenylyltransferase n=1 Tax=Mesorhabditis belari TaxID=2138241 RepID=A0AAF3EVM3_9BILA